jgi:PAS domain S-box-containing protein
MTTERSRSIKNLLIMDRRILVLGIGLGALYWVLESCLDAYVLKQGTFAQSFLSPNAQEVSTRLSELALIIFSWVALHSLFTRWKRADEALRSSEEKFSRAFRTSPDAITLTRLSDGAYLEVNEGFTRLMGYSAEEALASSILGLGHWADPEGRRRILEAMEDKGSVLGMEMPFRRKDGSVFIGSLSAAYLDLEGERCILATTRDVTEQREAEKKLRASLNEKEVLFKEVHHRVKNNLQIVSTLLELQSKFLVDERDLKTFKESQNRVRAMALIHEKLYGSKNLARLDLASYVKSLAAHLFEAFGADRGTVGFQAEVEDIALSMDKAVPFGLILNELVSNALKYAFPGGRKGTIRVELKARENGEVMLSVCDDGVGLPEEVDFRHAKTLGLHLVRMLAWQLQGSLDRVEGPGTRFVIAFRP